MALQQHQHQQRHHRGIEANISDDYKADEKMCPLWFAPGRAVCLVVLLNFSVWIPCYVEPALKLRHAIVGVGTSTTKCAVYPEGEADKTNILRCSLGRKQQRCDRVRRHVGVYHRMLHGCVDAHLEGQENWAKWTLRGNEPINTAAFFSITAWDERTSGRMEGELRDQGVKEV